MKVENFNHATAGDAGTSDIARRLLGDTWSPQNSSKAELQLARNNDGKPPALPEFMTNDFSPQNGPEQLQENLEKLPGPKTPFDKIRQAQPERAEQQEPQADTPEQRLKESIENAKEGKMDSAAKLMMLNGLVDGNVPGLYETANKLNEALTATGADFRVRIGMMQDENGVMDISFALVKSDEKAETILQDIVDNGNSSQYRERGMHIVFGPQEPDETQPVMPPPRRTIDI